MYPYNSKPNGLYNQRKRKSTQLSDSSEDQAQPPNLTTQNQAMRRSQQSMGMNDDDPIVRLAKPPPQQLPNNGQHFSPHHQQPAHTSPSNPRHALNSMSPGQLTSTVITQQHNPQPKVKPTRRQNYDPFLHFEDSSSDSEPPLRDLGINSSGVKDRDGEKSAITTQYSQQHHDSSYSVQPIPYIPPSRTSPDPVDFSNNGGDEDDHNGLQLTKTMDLTTDLSTTTSTATTTQPQPNPLPRKNLSSMSRRNKSGRTSSLQQNDSSGTVTVQSGSNHHLAPNSTPTAAPIDDIPNPPQISTSNDMGSYNFDQQDFGNGDWYDENWSTMDQFDDQFDQNHSQQQQQRAQFDQNYSQQQPQPQHGLTVSKTVEISQENIPIGPASTRMVDGDGGKVAAAGHDDDDDDSDDGLIPRSSLGRIVSNGVGERAGGFGVGGSRSKVGNTTSETSIPTTTTTTTTTTATTTTTTSPFILTSELRMRVPPTSIYVKKPVITTSPNLTATTKSSSPPLSSSSPPPPPSSSSSSLLHHPTQKLPQQPSNQLQSPNYNQHQFLSPGISPGGMMIAGMTTGMMDIDSNNNNGTTPKMMNINSINFNTKGMTTGMMNIDSNIDFLRNPTRPTIPLQQPHRTASTLYQQQTFSSPGMLGRNTSGLSPGVGFDYQQHQSATTTATTTTTTTAPSSPHLPQTTTITTLSPLLPRSIPTALLYDPEKFDIVLLCDNRERTIRNNPTKNGFWVPPTKVQSGKELKRLGVTCAMTTLAIGDFLWIMQPKQGWVVNPDLTVTKLTMTQQQQQLATKNAILGDNKEYGQFDVMNNQRFVLDFVIERKTLEDLHQTITTHGNRYSDQLRRLAQSGIRNVIYLIEDSTMSPNTDFVSQYKTGRSQHTSSSMASMSVQRGMFKVMTHDYEDTMNFLKQMHEWVEEYYKSIYNYVHKPRALNCLGLQFGCRRSYPLLPTYQLISRINADYNISRLYSFYTMAAMIQLGELEDATGLGDNGMNDYGGGVKNTAFSITTPPSLILSSHPTLHRLLGSYFESAVQQQVSVHERLCRMLSYQPTEPQKRSKSTAQLAKAAQNGQSGGTGAKKGRPAVADKNTLARFFNITKTKVDGANVDAFGIGMSSKSVQNGQSINGQDGVNGNGILQSKQITSSQHENSLFGTQDLPPTQMGIQSKMAQNSQHLLLLNTHTHLSQQQQQQQQSRSTTTTTTTTTTPSPSSNNPLPNLNQRMIGSGESFASFQTRLDKSADVTPVVKFARMLLEVKGVGPLVAETVATRYHTAANLYLKYHSILTMPLDSELDLGFDSSTDLSHPPLNTNNHRPLLPTPIKAATSKGQVISTDLTIPTPYRSGARSSGNGNGIVTKDKRKGQRSSYGDDSDDDLFDDDDDDYVGRGSKIRKVKGKKYRVDSSDDDFDDDDDDVDSDDDYKNSYLFDDDDDLFDPPVMGNKNGKGTNKTNNGKNDQMGQNGPKGQNSIGTNSKNNPSTSTPSSLHPGPKTLYGSSASHFLSDLFEPDPSDKIRHASNPPTPGIKIYPNDLDGAIKDSQHTNLRSLLSRLYPANSPYHNQQQARRLKMAQEYLCKYTIDDKNQKIGPVASTRIFKAIMLDYYD